jgi:hypothetical protein
MLSAVPDRADGVDYVPGRKTVALGELGMAGFATAEKAAFLD